MCAQPCAAHWRWGLGLGAAAAALLFTGAGLAADWWLEDARAALSLRILAPSLPFMAVSACLRGFFMARRKVGPNSRAQIFEQVVRIGVVALLIDSAVPQGIGTACAAVVVGNTVSEAASWVYMEWCYRRELRDVPRNAKRPGAGAGTAAVGYHSAHCCEPVYDERAAHR